MGLGGEVVATISGEEAGPRTWIAFMLCCGILIGLREWRKDLIVTAESTFLAFSSASL